MRTLRSPYNQLWRIAWGAALVMTTGLCPCPALDKPTGEPLALSSTETEQPVPLAYLSPDGKTAHCADIKLHWNPNPNVGPDDDATSFDLDLAADNPGASIFTAQLWNASLAAAQAWQQPWQGARWKVLLTPATDGTGIDAALAVGMIATSARRPYPVNTLVIGSLNPDGSLGPVPRLIERMDAAANAGITRVIIPAVQRFDTDATGQVVNMVRHASDLHLECVPVDTLVDATETAMNDPLPDLATGPSSPAYGNDIAGYIDDFAHHEESEADGNLKFAPKEADLTHYPPHIAAIWKSVYADVTAAQQAYRAGQIYVAYRLYAHANAGMSGANALVGQDRAGFDVKVALSESDDLRNHLHALMNPPAIDKDDLQSALLVAEMADWAYDINASLEGAQLVTKQTFSQRSDATDAEKDRARETILFAIEQNRYLLNQADFYTGLPAHLAKEPIAVDENAARLLPQLIPAQLATARVFTDGIRTRANELRDGLLFDPRLVAYINVLRDATAEWNARLRKQEMDAENSANTPDTANPSAPGAAAPLKPNAVSTTTSVAFDPGDTYRPPHTVVAPTSASKKLSDVAQCLIWADNDCEIATLDEKYLRLSGIIDPATHEWHVKDRAKLDALLQLAETGARQGIAFAEKAEVDSSVLSMIYERAAHLRIQEDDASALEALRNYWRCALLGNLCWQLAHSHKAQPVDVAGAPPANADKKTDAAPLAKTDDKTQPSNTPAVAPSPATSNPPAPATNTVVAVPPPTPPVPTPVPQPAVAQDPPVAPIATNPTEPHAPPRALPVTNETPPTPPAPPAPPAPVATNPDEQNIPVAPVARTQDYSGNDTAPATNAPPVIGPVPPATKSDNSDGHTPTFP